MSIERSSRAAPTRLQLAARQLAAYDQGGLDYLCGLYAIINGLRLMAAAEGRSLEDAHAERLFEAGVDFLDQEGKLAYAASHGISLGRWRRLADRLCQVAGRLLGSSVDVERPFLPHSRPPAATVWAAIEQALDRHRPVLVLLRGSYDHFTVVSELSSNRVMLFDSYHYRWIMRTACGPQSRRHQLAAASISILRLKADVHSQPAIQALTTRKRQCQPASRVRRTRVEGRLEAIDRAEP
jgi:hypothetical protein